MNEALAQNGWKKEKVFAPLEKPAFVCYRIASMSKLDRGQARKSLEDLSEAIEAQESFLSASFTSISGTLDFTGKGTWRTTLTVKLAGVEQVDFFHLVQ